MRFRTFPTDIGLILLIFLLSTPTAIRADALKFAQIHQRMNALLALQQRLSQQIDQAHKVRMAFADKKQDYVDEIKAQHQSLKTKTFQVADRRPRIHFNLLLITRLTGYIDMLDQRIDTFQLGKERLAYLYQEADDNLKMIETLNDIQVDNLLARIDEAVAECQIESEKDLLEPIDRLPTETPEASWQQIVADLK